MKGVLLAVTVVFLLHKISATDDSSTRAIPLSIMRTNGMLDAMKSDEKFARYLLDDYNRMRLNGRRPSTTHINYNGTIIGSQNLSSIERSELQSVLHHAGCEPYDQVVPLANSRPDVIMYPSCVLIKQCGGCCGHPALTCSPSSVKEKFVTVTKYEYDGTSMFPQEMVDYVSVEEHQSCDCVCKVKESDCDPNLHKFSASECQCKCKDDSQRESCPDNKKWNDGICACQCSRTINCGTGYTFNMNTCVCDEITQRNGEIPTITGNQPATNSPAPSDVTVDVCGHLRCPRRYKPALKPGGGCRCVYSRRSNSG